ncbi:MAG TPA: aromatic-ring-hydroxylating dioxygenase subunit beta [Burkholderiales bacterium]|nr:aromatic-ring-hydroxylating dioxygenase subunit beta [Burkholderiales bacterium]
MTEVEALILREARLLDEQRYADWLALFADDGVYWIPTRPAQASPHEALSIIYEPKSLLAMRVERLQRKEMHVQSPPSRTVHHVSAVEVAGDEAHSSLIVAEWRAGEARWFAARVTHKLRNEANGLRIVLKRVDLTDGEAPHRAIAVPL